MDDLDAAFPGWRSIELFGASGTGKTQLCRNLADDAIWATCDDDRIQKRIAATKHPVTRLLLPIAGASIRRKHARWRERRELESLLTAPDVREYLKLADQVVSTAGFTGRRHRGFVKAIQVSAALLVLAHREGRRVLVDEGIVRRIVALVTLGWERGVSEEQTVLIRACLSAYPWEKKAILLEAPLATRMSRVREREAEKADHLMPHIQNHEAGELVGSLASQSGWQVETLQTG